MFVDQNHKNFGENQLLSSQRTSVCIGEINLFSLKIFGFCFDMRLEMGSKKPGRG